MIDKQQLADLRAKAEAATPGPWVRHHRLHGVSKLRDDGGYDWVGAGDSDPTADYIVAANPATVLALLDEIERLRSEVRQAVELIERAAPRFYSYEECQADDQGANCTGRDYHEHELRHRMDEFVERHR